MIDNIEKLHPIAQVAAVIGTVVIVCVIVMSIAGSFPWSR